MNYSKFKFTLNIQSPISQRSIPIKLNDTARSLYISLRDGGAPYTIPDGCRAVFFGKKADGSELVNDCIIEHNTTVKYDFTANTANVAGTVKCEIRIYGPDGLLLTGPKFVMVVDARVVYDDSTPLTDGESTAWDNIFLTEQERMSAEQERVAAEQERVAAEAARKTASEAATSNANSAAQRAETISATLEKKLETGEFGLDGEDGLTPYIGENGNWWVGDTDTGKPSRGADGVKGDKGEDLGIYQSFPSIAEMEAAADSIPLNKIILIDTVDNSHEDNAKLFVRSKDGFSFLKKVDVTLRDIPLQTGETENSLVFSGGTAKGEYSIAGGTDSAEAIIDEEYLKLLSLAGTKVEFDLPQTEKPLGVAYGIGAKSKSTLGTAVGANVTSGVRGYYWWKIDGNTFELSTTRKAILTVRKAPESLDWEKGDYVCVKNKENYPFLAQITEVDHTNKKITVDSLPDINGEAFSDQYDNKLTLLPNDMTIFAVQRGLSNISGCYEFKVRSGEVELGWGATVLGALSTGAGSLSFNTGFSNLSYDFGSVSGRENMGGYASLTSGFRNIDRGRYNLMAGRNNTIFPCASTSIIGGKWNKTSVDNVIMGGSDNEASELGASSILVGDGLRATEWDQAVFGIYNDPYDVKDPSVLSELNLLMLGNGWKDPDSGEIHRRNAFRVTRSGNTYAFGNIYAQNKKLVTADEIYPVGSVYISTKTSAVGSSSPASWLGGTWERIKDRFLLAAGDKYLSGNTGGSADAVLIQHNHEVISKEGNRIYVASGTNASGHLLKNAGVDYVTNGADSDWKLTVNSAGTENGTGKNMPPYLVVYMWKRIA